MTRLGSDACYIVKTSESLREQDPRNASFVGGRPVLPAEIPLPSCRLCGQPLTFFFQLEFPGDTPWGGRSLTVFANTACYHDGNLIPEFVPGELHGVTIPKGFLSEYQKAFRVFVFDFKQGILRSDYTPRIKHRRLKLTKAADSNRKVSKIGGRPTWYLEDEAPASYAGRAMGFLLQIVRPFPYDLEDACPGQMEVNFFDENKIEPSGERVDSLFVDAPLYLFGTLDEGEPGVYIVPQKR